MLTYRSLLFAAITGFCFLFVGAPLASAQSLPTEESEAFIKEFARPGRATMMINVWGNAGSPGLWRVERDIDMIDFLTLVGVSGVGDRQRRVRTKTYVAIYRTTDSGKHRQTYREQVENILDDGARYPQLRDGDILSVETEERSRIGLQLLGTIVGTASSITLLVLRLTSN